MLVPREKDEGRQPFDWLGFVLSGSALFCLLYVAELLGRPQIAWYQAIAYTFLGLVLLALGVRHLNRATHR